MMAEDLAVSLWPGVFSRRRVAGELEELARGLFLVAQKDGLSTDSHCGVRYLHKVE